MVQRIRVGKRVLVAPAAGLLLVGAFAVTGTTTALGDTHGNCVQFDSNGNFVGVTPSCSETLHVTSPPMFFPASTCAGAPGIVELDDNHSVFHINVNSARDAWLTGTDGGTASFTPSNPSDPSGQGTWTSWFGEKFNNHSTVNGSTQTIRLHLSDGTEFVFHENTHATLTPGGVTLSHDNLVTSCG